MDVLKYSTISIYHGTKPIFGIGDAKTGSRDYNIRYLDNTLGVVASSYYDINRVVIYAFDSRLSATNTYLARVSDQQRPALLESFNDGIRITLSYEKQRIKKTLVKQNKCFHLQINPRSFLLKWIG